MGNGPLTGIKVLDLTQFEAGTACTENLAWLGAEIWKVERPVKGELGRYSAVAPGVDTYGFILLNMNKKSITCNMKTPEGIALIKQLIPKVDVIAENMGPGSMERLGLSYEECKALNDKIVYCSIKGLSILVYTKVAFFFQKAKLKASAGCRCLKHLKTGKNYFMITFAISRTLLE